MAAPKRPARRYLVVNGLSVKQREQGASSEPCGCLTTKSKSYNSVPDDVIVSYGI